jgi:hypothetical protein
VGNAGTASGQLRTPLSTGSYRLARNIAAELPHVEPVDAIRLTCLAASKDPDRFDGLAVRAITRQIEGRRLSLNDVIWAAQRFPGLPGGC